MPPARDWSDPSTAIYPDPAFEVFDPRFAKYSAGTTGLVRIWTGGVWTEGPVWFGDQQRLIFSDIPNDRLMAYDATTGRTEVFRQPSNFTNGNTRDRQGRLVSCEQGTRRVTRTEYDGSITTLADKFDGKPLNSPNGVIVKSDDTVWFTDPSYGIGGDHKGNREEAELPRNVYRLDPKTGKMDVVVGDFSMPNGLCFSPDEKKFYVTDTGALGGPFKQTLIRVYDVSDDGKLSNGRLLHDFKDVPQPYIADDIRVDEDGNVWAAGGWSPNRALNGVRVVRAGRHAARRDRGAGSRRQSLLRRSSQKPTVHLRQHLGLCDRRGHARRRVVGKANQRLLPQPGGAVQAKRIRRRY